MVNVIILAIARIINGAYPLASVGDDVQSIGFGRVIGITLVVGLLGWGLLLLLERTTARAATIWLAVAIMILLLSFLGPLGSGENTSSKVTLALMHVAVAVTIIPAMWRLATMPSA